jgi:hypothetical protein
MTDAIEEDNPILEFKKYRDMTERLYWSVLRMENRENNVSATN